MYNISAIEKKDCCGCEACCSVCPTEAIKMQPDLEGFLYPSVDKEFCIVGDFWRIENIDKTLDDNKRLSFLLVNTSRGNDLLSSFSKQFRLVDILLEEYSVKYTGVCM